MITVSEIVLYMVQHPSLQRRIDSAGNQDFSEGRADAARDAPISAEVPAAKFIRVHSAIRSSRATAAFCYCGEDRRARREVRRQPLS
jgi:hypothetical protein